VNHFVPTNVRKVMSELTPTTRTESVLPEPPLPLALSRRNVLRVVAVTGAGAAVLVACGGGDDTAGTGSGETSTSAPADDSSSAAATESPDDGGGAGGGGLVATADVPVKGGVVLDGKKIVVTQPTAGEFKAFTAVCTHMQCIVSSVKNNTISCPCHGSTYSASDGSVKGGPAPSPLRPVAVTVEGDQVVQA
jgi:Rieske Fe-S protein